MFNKFNVIPDVRDVTLYEQQFFREEQIKQIEQNKADTGLIGFAWYFGRH